MKNKKFILGTGVDILPIIQYKSEKEAAFESEVWVIVMAKNLKEAKAKYEETFADWQKRSAGDYKTCTVREDIQHLGVPVGDEYYSGTEEMFYKWEGDKFFIFHDWEWKEAESIDWEFSTAKEFVNKKAPALECVEYDNSWNIRDSGAENEGCFVYSKISEEDAWEKAKQKILSYDKELIIKGSILKVCDSTDGCFGFILTHCEQDEIEGWWDEYLRSVGSYDFEGFVDYLNNSMGIPTKIIETKSVHTSF